MQDESLHRPSDPGPGSPRPARGWVRVVIAAVLVAAVAIGAVAVAHHRSHQAASSDRAVVLQIRGVRSVVAPSSPTYAETKETCGADAPCTADVLLRAPNLVLEDATGLKYRLGPVAVTGDDVASASAVTAAGTWAVRLQLSHAASVRFAEVTARMAEVLPPRSVAMIVDGQVVSAPIVQAPVTGGVGFITGNFTQAQAKSLAARLT